MDATRARDLLENLLERATLSSDKVFLTSKEVSALAVLLGNDESVAGSSISSQGPTLTPVNVAQEEILADAMLCVDFGTSFSKAFVSLGNEDPELVDLPIGDEGSRLTTPSELFIDDGQIYFGPGARRRWDDIQAPTDRLIDSIKQFITLNADVSVLGERPMTSAKDPGQKFSQRDIVLLYLGHLMALTERALAEKGFSSNIKRRFTHPAWKDGSREQNEHEMRRLMAEAVLLARSAPAEFSSKMPVATARRLLDQLAAVDSEALPNVLIGEPVREATAAGAGALLATREGEREVYLVLDIGAGTTDVAGFYCVNNPNHHRMRVFEITLAADARNMAGNALDSALQKLVMEKSGLSQESEEAHLASHNLRRQIRAYKERLFDNESVIVELATDQTIEIDLKEFLAFGPVVNINAKIKDLVAQSAIVVAGDRARINLVATGGGAGLPLVRELGNAGVNRDGQHIDLRLIDAMPSDVRANYPDWVDPYPQIAVALGGSLPNLPEQRSNVGTAISQAPRRTLAPQYRS